MSSQTPTPGAELSTVQLWLRALVFGSVYWLLGESCEGLGLLALQAPLLWLPAGFLMGVLLLHPTKSWGPIALMAGLASVLIESPPDNFNLVQGLVALCLPASIVLVAWLLRRYSREKGPLDELELGPWSVLGAGVGAGALVGAIRLLERVVMGRANAFDGAETWFGATTIGVLIVCPLVLSAASLDRRFVRTSWVFWLELTAVTAVTAAITGMMFLRQQDIASPFWPPPFLIFPILIWAALRLGNLGISAALLTTGMLAAAATPDGLGPVAQLADTDEKRAMIFQGFVIVAALTSYLLASATEKASEAAHLASESEDRYRSIFEGASDAIILSSRDGRIIDANGACEELTGYSREQLVGMLSRDLIDPADLDRQPWRDAEVLEGRAFVHDRLIIRADGRKMLVEAGVKPLPDGRVTAICRELGQNRKLEFALKAIVSGTAVHTGEAFFEHLAKGLAEALGVRHAHVAELLEKTPEVARSLAVWADGEAKPEMTYNLKNTPCARSVEDRICFCREGVQHKFPEDTMLVKMGAESYLGVVITDRFGKRIGLLAVLDDKRIEAIEPGESILRIFAARAGAELERLRSENALRQSEARQRALLEAFPDSFFVMTLDGFYLNYHTLEPERLRLPPEKFIGKTYREVMPPELHPLFAQAFDDLRAGKKPRVFEYESDIGGGRRHFEVRHNYVGDGLVLAILRDVTLRKEYDEEIQKLNENLERLVERRTEQLAAANRELETFAYSVSHDLRAPLRGIHANASILKEELGPRLSPSDEETIDRILARATEMSNLIDGLLKISRIMRTELQREDIDLTALSKEAFDRVRRWHPERIIQFTVPAGLATKGDRVLLLAALTNLFDNAIKFTVHQPEARIEMNATVEDFETVYWVSDNGVGFDMEHAGKLFRPFERLHSGDEFAGTGIGLATVQRVVQRHGGRIWAEGKVGGGATFYFTLGPASESPRDSILESRRESVSGTEFGADGRQTDTEP